MEQQSAEKRNAKGAKGATRSHEGKGLVLARMFTRPGVDPLERGSLREPRQHHHRPRRHRGVPAQERRDPRRLVAAGHRHRGLQVLPQGRHPRRRQARRDQRARPRVPRGAHHPRGGRQVRRLLRQRGGRRRLRGRAQHILIHQKGAFNSPVWFNCGLFQRYGIEGSGGNYAFDPVVGAVVETKNAYEQPAVLAPASSRASPTT